MADSAAPTTEKIPLTCPTLLTRITLQTPTKHGHQATRMANVAPGSQQPLPRGTHGASAQLYAQPAWICKLTALANSKAHLPLGPLTSAPS
jgi:hypothetical protein